MKLIRAEHLGFCSGVQRAIALAESCLALKALYATGPLVHNNQLIADMQDRGLHIVDDLDRVPQGAAFIVRAHGMSRSQWDDLNGCAEQNDLEIIDATCPCVERIFQLAAESAEKYDRVIILGEHGHPEVEAAASWAGSKGIVIADLGELEQIMLEPEANIAIIAQSTLEQTLFSIFVDKVRRDFQNHVVFNTICSATKLRQDAAVLLAEQVDRMIVIGGYHSANTKHLYDLCKRVNTMTVLVERASELLPGWLDGAEIIGLTAGASTPEWIIEEVETKVMEWEKNLEAHNVEVEEQEKAEEKAEEVVEAETQTETEAKEEDAGLAPLAETESVPSDQQDEMADMNAVTSEDLEEALERGAFDLPRHKVGDIIKATVVNIRSDEVMIDVGLKSEGVIPRRELSYDTSLPADEIVSVGEEIEVMVWRSEDQEGRITFSKKHADQRKNWDKILEIYERGEIIEGKVLEAIKGGLLVDIGVRGFMPASQAERRYTNDLKHLVGQIVRVKLLEVEVDRERHRERAIVSRKVVLDMEAEAAKQEFWSKAQEGDVVRGVVRRLTDFGAFVDLGGVDGLLHISDMAYHRVNKPSDIIDIGQEVELKILKLNPETSKVSLGLKQMQPKPWEALSAEVQPNDVIEGTVVRITPWGAFVNVRPGIDGLIHISELDNQRVAKVDDVVQIGDVVQALILGINPEKERLSLSLKALKAPAQQYADEQEYEEDYQADEAVFENEEPEAEDPQA